MSRSKFPYRPTVADHRRRYARRKVVGLAVAAAIVAALVLADQLGVFGTIERTGDMETYHNKTFRVARVIDGDTLDIDLPDRHKGHPTTRIRLWGVDTPETVKENTPIQHFGPEATEFTKRSCHNKQVRLELVAGNTRDRHGRLLAYVYTTNGDGKKMLNAELIAGGYGYADERFDHARKREFRRLQRQAQQAGRGLWKDVRNSDLPYYYRGKIKPKR